VSEQLRSTAIADASSTVIRRLETEAAQNVPMLENIQYQNQMISPVPPHAATYRSISQM
jgi:hypothetical protein